MYSVQKVVQYSDSSSAVYSQSSHETQRAAELKAESLALDEKEKTTVFIVLEVVRTNDHTVRIRPHAQYAARTAQRRNIVTAKIPKSNLPEWMKDKTTV